MEEHITIADFSKVSPLKSILVIVKDWLLIVLSFYVFYKWGFYSLIFLVPFIASRMYSLYSLLHDGVHYLIHPNKILNDLISKAFLAYPLFISFNEMRSNHFLHHSNLKKDNDPELIHLKYDEFSFPLNRNTMLCIFIKDLLAYNFVKYKFSGFVNFIKKWQFSFTHNQLYIILKYIIFVSLLIFLFHLQILHYFFLLWIIPYATFYQALNRFRLYTEHFNIPESNVKTKTI
jgi:fatty acid desaturase